MDVIRCEGLTKRYGDATAVDRLDLSVASGQVFGFLGPNGAGKTTTLRMLLGLVRPTAGRAWVNGRLLPDPDGLHDIGCMIEEPAFHPWLSGRRNLEILALSGPAPRRADAVDAALDRVGLTDAAGRKVRGYSQGMRQRLGLAAVLLRQPSVLLLDEPTNGMDPAGIRELRALLRSVADAGATVFLSSHLLSEIEQVCDRVAVLSGGRLVAQGPVGELTAARERVRVVVDETDLAAARRLLARWPLHPAGPGELLVEGASGREVNRLLAGGGVWAHQVGTEPARLEDVYVRLTGGADGAGTEEVPHAASPR